MKNLKYFPFERNRYFYGKFLSVDDFEAEQRYMNDKRRLINRFLHGCGVVCGLQVVEVDDLTISVEAGLALDFSGREIMVPVSVTKRLSAIEGYSCEEDEEERQTFYLCIAYAERSVEPVHNITRVNAEQEEEHNKYEEGYRLFVTKEEPEQEGFQTNFAFEESRTIYEGEGIRIWQTVPKYMQKGEASEITITIEKGALAAPIAFAYELRLNHIEQQGKECLNIGFDEKQFAPSEKYVLKERIQAKNVEWVEGSVEVAPDSFSLTIGQDTKKKKADGKFKVLIRPESMIEAMIKEYYGLAMEEIMRDPYGGAIYLAKLEVIRAGDTYVIEGVENSPFRQLVWNGTLSGALESFRLKPNPMESHKQQSSFDDSEAIRLATQAVSQIEVESGSTEIYIGIGGVPGRRFYSEEIVHGLGLGNVCIFLGLVGKEAESSQIIFGNQDIFKEYGEPNVAMAAKVNPRRGSFMIGIKCLDNVEAKKLHIFWMAVKHQGQEEKAISSMEIRPNIVNLKVRESCYLEAVMGNKVQRHVKWSVREKEGGTIDKNGCYTAPNQPGVYEVTAEDLEQREVQASAYIIVRDALA